MNDLDEKIRAEEKTFEDEIRQLILLQKLEGKIVVPPKPLSRSMSACLYTIRILEEYAERNEATEAWEWLTKERWREGLLRLYHRVWFETTIRLKEKSHKELVDLWIDSGTLSLVCFVKEGDESLDDAAIRRTSVLYKGSAVFEVLEPDSIPEYLVCLYLLAASSLCQREVEERSESHPELLGTLKDVYLKKGSAPIINSLIPDANTELAKGFVELLAWLEGFGRETISQKTEAELSELLMKRWSAAIRRPVGRIGRQYQDKIHPDDARSIAHKGLMEGAEYWEKKDTWEILMAGLKGQLGNSLRSTVSHDLIDAIRKEKEHQKRQLLEKDYRGKRLKLLQPDGSSTIIRPLKRDVDKVEEVTPLFDRIPTSQLGPEQLLEKSANETLDLKRLGFNKDELTPRELLLLDELRDAADKGYRKDSKEGLSLKQYWGEDYDRKMKMLQRLEAKRKKP